MTSEKLLRAPVDSQTRCMHALAALSGLDSVGPKEENMNVERKVGEMDRGRIGGKRTGGNSKVIVFSFYV